MWQSVDYALLSTPTRPGSPHCEQSTQSVEFDFSPSQLFDFPATDFGSSQNIELENIECLLNLQSLQQPSEPSS